MKKGWQTGALLVTTAETPQRGAGRSAPLRAGKEQERVHLADDGTKLGRIRRIPR
jgi:hypothetical protein